MANFNDFFGFSTRQIKTLWVALALAVASSFYLTLSDYSSPDPQAEGLTVYIGGTDRTYHPLFILDLNSSPADSLELIPGIGPVFASRIVAYRDSTGGFATIEEIIQVRGIGRKLYSKIKPYLTALR